MGGGGRGQPEFHYPLLQTHTHTHQRECTESPKHSPCRERGVDRRAESHFSAPQ